MNNREFYYREYKRAEKAGNLEYAQNCKEKYRMMTLALKYNLPFIQVIPAITGARNVLFLN